jgi:hypothetical protein
MHNDLCEALTRIPAMSRSGIENARDTSALLLEHRQNELGLIRRTIEASGGGGTMSRSDYRTLLNHGRKAGLSTREMYSALATRPSEASDRSNRQADGNGFVSDYSKSGQRIYRPISGTGT